jgi:hypothetical protein
MTHSEGENPFVVQTPEGISAEEARDLFVDVFTEFRNVPNPGHAFIHGPRGSGKSMMFRYLEPDCQRLVTGLEFMRHPFFGVYVPVKNLSITELRRLEERYANIYLNEHLLVAYITSKVFASLLKAGPSDSDGKGLPILSGYVQSGFARLLQRAGFSSIPSIGTPSSIEECLKALVRIFDDVYVSACDYLGRISLRRTPPAYEGPLLSYLNFLLPVARELKELGFVPAGPIYLLLDDADNLNEVQTMILNSWVSCRTSADLSLKISTQLSYKTYRTTSGQTIDAPHDYSEINISDIYTSEKSTYHKRVNEIVRRRLNRKGITVEPEEFFPADKKQELAIKRIEDAYRGRWRATGKGFRPRDDAYRYSRPDYIASLGGKKKASSKYSYAGFDQLVHLSSGIIRFFLEPASKMYTSMQALHPEQPITKISVAVQDRIAREEANDYLLSEFDKLAEGVDDPTVADRTTKLRNLIYALGGTFHQILTSDASERRVFSVAFSDGPSKDVLDVLKLGVRYGYFHEKSIGNKEGTGRTRMFVLSKRLAPFFTLDPTGFSGYKFVTSAAIEEAMSKPKAILARVRDHGPSEFLDPAPQLSLFIEE